MTAKSLGKSSNIKVIQYQTQIIWKIKNISVLFNVDISVSDVIIPHTKKQTIQALIHDFEKLVTMICSIESMIV